MDVEELRTGAHAIGIVMMIFDLFMRQHWRRHRCCVLRL